MYQRKFRLLRKAGEMVRHMQTAASGQNFKGQWKQRRKGQSGYNERKSSLARRKRQQTAYEQRQDRQWGDC
ncbi:hypothetical protein D3C87_2200940 [compost metagenome]